MELYDTRTLVGVIEVQKPLVSFWRKWFPRVLTFDTQDIMFDIVAPDRRLAPFVAPNVQGRVMRETGHTAKVFRPAYVKPKHIIEPSRAIPRRAGERIAGEMSMGQRFNAIVVDNIRKEREMIERRFEWLCAKATMDGEVTIAGDDYPSVTVDFGRDNTLTDALTGTERWSETTSTPLSDIETMRRAAFTLASAPITTLVFGLAAWASFSTHADVKDLLDTTYRGSTSDLDRASLAEPGPFEWRGRLSSGLGSGGLDLWTYSDQYDDLTGTPVDILDTDTVVGVGPGIQGVQCFGAIRDADAGPMGLAAMEMFPKMWKEQDPSAVYTMTQSAPLMVPAQPNGSFKIKVNALA